MDNTPGPPPITRVRAEKRTIGVARRKRARDAFIYGRRKTALGYSRNSLSAPSAAAQVDYERRYWILLPVDFAIALLRELLLNMQFQRSRQHSSPDGNPRGVSRRDMHTEKNTSFCS